MAHRVGQRSQTPPPQGGGWAPVQPLPAGIPPRVHAIGVRVLQRPPIVHAVGAHVQPPLGLPGGRRIVPIHAVGAHVNPPAAPAPMGPPLGGRAPIAVAANPVPPQPPAPLPAAAAPIPAVPPPGPHVALVPGGPQQVALVPAVQQPPPAGPQVALVPAQLVKTALKAKDAAGQIIQIESTERDAAKRQALDMAFTKVKRQILNTKPHAKKITVDVVQRTIRYEEGTPPEKHLLDLDECCQTDPALQPLVVELEKAIDDIWGDPKDTSHEYRQVVLRSKKEGPQPIQAHFQAEQRLQGDGIDAKTGEWDQKAIASCMKRIYEAYQEMLGAAPSDVDLVSALQRMSGGIAAVKTLHDQLKASLAALKAPDSHDTAKYPLGDKDPRYTQDQEKYKETKQALENTLSRVLKVDWVALFTNLAFATPFVPVPVTQEERIKAGLERAEKIRTFIQALVEKEKTSAIKEYEGHSRPRKWIPGPLPGSVQEPDDEPANKASTYAKEIATVSFAALDPLERRRAYFQFSQEQERRDLRLSSVEEGFVHLVLEKQGVVPVDPLQHNHPFNLPTVLQDTLALVDPAMINTAAAGTPPTPGIDPVAIDTAIGTGIATPSIPPRPSAASVAVMAQTFDNLCQSLHAGNAQPGTP